MTHPRSLHLPSLAPAPGQSSPSPPLPPQSDHLAPHSAAAVAAAAVVVVAVVVAVAVAMVVAVAVDIHTAHDAAGAYADYTPHEEVGDNTLAHNMDALGNAVVEGAHTLQEDTLAAPISPPNPE